jgi:hypothetical protein
MLTLTVPAGRAARLARAAKKGRPAIGRRRFRIARGGSAVIPVRVSRRGRELIERHRKARVKVTSVTTSGGSTQATSSTIVVRTPKRGRS